MVVYAKKPIALTVVAVVVMVLMLQHLSVRESTGVTFGLHILHTVK